MSQVKYDLKQREIPSALLDASQMAAVISPDNSMLSALCNVLSLSLCSFERYGCRLARELLPKVSDPKVADALAGFIRQEAGHTKVHMQYNNALQQLGYVRMTEMEQSNEYFMQAIGVKSGDLRHGLHYAVLIELHMANFARYFLRIMQDQMADMHPITAYLFGFHFIEECEHRSVLFDAYNDVYGYYPNQTATNIAEWHKLEKILIARLISGMAYVLSSNALKENKLVSARKLKREIQEYLFANSGCFPSGYICREYADKNFHPYFSHLDDDAWIMKWDNEYAPYLLNKISSRHPGVCQDSGNA